ncbi:hypothetical protein TrRE_jg12284, partial [Triparma retinervis]
MACKVFDGLFIGDAESSQDSEFIELNKISYVINCAGRQLPNLYELHGIRYLTYPWLDTTDFQIFDANGVVVMQIVSFIDEALNAGEAVLCHSLNGVSRCSLCMIAYMMYKYWWSLEKSMEFLCSKRPDLAPNNGFLQQLQIVDAQLQTARRLIIENGGNQALGQTLKTAATLNRQPFPSPQYASSMMKSKRKVGPNSDPKATLILESKLFEWESEVVRQFAKLVGDEVSEELLLVNSYVNSHSDLASFPGPGDTQEHIATRLRWVDVNGAGGGEGGGRGGGRGAPSKRPWSSRSKSTMCPGNIVAGVDKIKIERPPNDGYSSFQLGHGWVDREKKVAAPKGAKARKLIRSILKGGKEKLQQQAEVFEAARSLARQLARVQHDSAKHALSSPTSVDRPGSQQLASLSLKEEERKQAAASLLQSDFILHNSDFSVSTGSAPGGGAAAPHFLYDGGSSLGSLSSMGSPIHRP